MALDTAHTLTLTVDGTDVTGYLVESSLRLQTVIGAELDTCAFDLVDYDGLLGAFTSWLEVIVTDETATRLFGGYAAQVRARHAPGGENLIWSITALDYGVLFQKRIVDQTFVGKTAAYMIDTLVQAELSGLGFDSTTYVATGGTYDIRFDRRTLFDAIKELSDKDNFIWWVDSTKHLHYVDDTSGAAAPFQVSDLAHANWTTIFPVDSSGFDVEEDASDIRNTVTVHGGVQTSEPVVEDFTGDGVTTDFAVAYSPINACGTVTVEGVEQQVGRDFIDDPARFPVLVNWTYGVLKFAVAPALGAAISIAYTYDAAIRTAVVDATSVATYGTHEYVHVDLSIASSAQAALLANAILSRYKNPTTAGRCTVERYGLAAGQILKVTDTALNWTAREFIIQNVVLTYGRKGITCAVQFGSREPSLLDALRGVAGGAGGIATGGIGSGAGTALGGRLDSRQPTGYQYVYDSGSGTWFLLPIYNVTIGNGEFDFSDDVNSGYIVALI